MRMTELTQYSNIHSADWFGDFRCLLCFDLIFLRWRSHYAAWLASNLGLSYCKLAEWRDYACVPVCQTRHCILHTWWELFRPKDLPRSFPFLWQYYTFMVEFQAFGSLLPFLVPSALLKTHFPNYSSHFNIILNPQILSADVWHRDHAPAW